MTLARIKNEMMLRIQIKNILKWFPLKSLDFPLNNDIIKICYF